VLVISNASSLATSTSFEPRRRAMPDDFGGIRPPRREIDIARECIDQILDLENLDVVECIHVIDLLRKSADYMEESVQEFALKTTLLDDIVSIRAQNDMLRALMDAEDGKVSMEELQGDGT
jgi:hypothetical protein